MGVAIILLRLWVDAIKPGEGGCGGDGESSRWMSLFTTMCDWEELRGLPRKKELKIVVRDGGESLPVSMVVVVVKEVEELNLIW